MVALDDLLCDSEIVSEKERVCSSVLDALAESRVAVGESVPETSWENVLYVLDSLSVSDSV